MGAGKCITVAGGPTFRSPWNFSLNSLFCNGPRHFKQPSCDMAWGIDMTTSQAIVIPLAMYQQDVLFSTASTSLTLKAELSSAASNKMERSTKAFIPGRSWKSLYDSHPLVSYGDALNNNILRCIN